MGVVWERIGSGSHPIFGREFSCFRRRTKKAFKSPDSNKLANNKQHTD